MRPRRLAATLAILAVLALAPAAGAASITHMYDFDATYADALGGPAVVPNGGSFVADEYRYLAGQGPSLSGAIDPSVYSLEMRFSLDVLSGYKKLLDFKDYASDTGFYNNGGHLYFAHTSGLYSGAGDPVVFAIGSRAKLAVTRDATSTVRAYVNGTFILSFSDTANLATFSAASAIIRFLNDDFNAGENPAGYLDYIRVYQGVLTDSEVSRLASGESPLGVAPPVPEPVALGWVALAGLLWRRRTSEGREPSQVRGPRNATGVDRRRA